MTFLEDKSYNLRLGSCFTSRRYISQYRRFRIVVVTTRPPFLPLLALLFDIWSFCSRARCLGLGSLLLDSCRSRTFFDPVEGDTFFDPLLALVFHPDSLYSEWPHVFSFRPVTLSLDIDGRSVLEAGAGSLLCRLQRLSS